MPLVPPNLAQVILLLSAALLFILGALASIARLRHKSHAMSLLVKSLDYWGICGALTGLVWRCIDRGSILPLGDNFQTLAALGVLLAMFSIYMQTIRPVPGLDWFVMPIAALLLVGAAIFGRFMPDRYRADSVWTFTHLLSSFGGTVAFAVAAAVGCMYLRVSANLRRKPAAPAPNFTSLERLENIAHAAAILGFALWTLGMITGLAIVIHEGSHTLLGRYPLATPKVILAFAAWVVYALALHTPMTPALRGRKSAYLSVVGFILILGTIIAVQFTPGGR